MLTSPPPEVSKMIQTLGDQNARQLLCYLTGEENRGCFEAWEVAQFVLGTALVGSLLFGIEKRLLAGLAGAMLILALFQHFKITPELSWMGRSVDFLGRGVASTRSVLETAGHLQRNRSGKDAAAVTIAGLLFPMRRGRSRQRAEIDPVDYANHRHASR